MKIKQRAIELDFPFEFLSQIAEVESWRKEIYRPIYHLHKWWAQRLGSVFRAMILGAALPKNSNVLDAFYDGTDLNGLVVFDPFMGSGTTVGEACKLGCTAVGRDINSVAFNSVVTALGPLNRLRLSDLYSQLEHGVAAKIRSLYRTKDSSGSTCDVLYYFWVLATRCPSCLETVELFSTYIFARHAYVKKFPKVHIFCPGCRNIFAGLISDQSVKCPECDLRFDPQQGPAQRQTAKCRSCACEFPIAPAVRTNSPAYELYAKLVLTKEGKKEYLPITKADRLSLQTAESEFSHVKSLIPDVDLKDGVNTKQAMNYGFRSWAQFFNRRQLYALTMLAEAIKNLPDCPEKRALAIIFSGSLEFNNMFASYKGEGTGAVRHMFSHHILKPERMPIEANVWGTDASSGSFSTLFKTRLLRALEYRDKPFEIRVKGTPGRLRGEKSFAASRPIMPTVVIGVPPGNGNAKAAPPTVYLSCGSSSKTDMPDKVVDLVVTDPPFFDNVHYSELADFFAVWQRKVFGVAMPESTRHIDEVQDPDADAFSNKLAAVFRECHRVLKDDGLLVFSYHHSRDDGWRSVVESIARAGFSVTQCHPVKAEMSVAAPKAQAKEPIDLDIILVCRKTQVDNRAASQVDDALTEAEQTARAKVERFNATGRLLSKNDVRIILISETLRILSAGRHTETLLDAFSQALPQTADTATAIASSQAVPTTRLLQQVGSATAPLALSELPLSVA